MKIFVPLILNDSYINHFGFGNLLLFLHLSLLSFYLDDFPLHHFNLLISVKFLFDHVSFCFFNLFIPIHFYRCHDDREENYNYDKAAADQKQLCFGKGLLFGSFFIPFLATLILRVQRISAIDSIVYKFILSLLVQR